MARLTKLDMVNEIFCAAVEKSVRENSWGDDFGIVRVISSELKQCEIKKSYDEYIKDPSAAHSILSGLMHETYRSAMGACGDTDRSAFVRICAMRFLGKRYY